MSEFIIPSFLKNRSIDEVHKKIIESIPDDIDMSEGSFPWDFTRPTASAVSMMCEFIIPEALKVAFPQYAYDSYLDYHANARGINRNAATVASGYITVTGTAGTFIETGSLFSTASTDGEPSVDYETTVEATIPDSGTINIPVQCTMAGIQGNTQAGTVIFVGSKINGISFVTNSDPITGGTEKETDDHLRERIAEYDKSQSDSYVGNDADYKRWAKSVNGVGEAVIIPAQDDTGLVKIIITDASGNPGNEALCQAVYNYIMSPDDRMKRLAPVNALLSVIPPETENISISAVVELSDGATIESVKTNYLAAIKSYLPKAMDDGEIKLSTISALLTSVQGINDYKEVKINGGTLNIPLTSSQLPTVTEDGITLTIGVVS